MLKKIKDNIIKKTLLYKIYRYFKYKIHPNKSYAGYGEEILLQKIFLKKINGFYIDVGALHPINGSITYRLYKKGWHGINLDLTKKNIQLLKFFRKRDISIQKAVSSSSGNINSYIFDDGSGLNTLEKEWAEKWKKIINKKYKTVRLPKTTLDNIINKYNIPKNFDLLNIDVEGHELEVLKGINLKKYRPKIITVEIHVKKNIRNFQITYTQNFRK